MRYRILPTPSATSSREVDEAIHHWPRYARKAAKRIIDKYGLPHEVGHTLLMWHHNSPWKRTVVYREGTPHNFPRTHLDTLEQTVDYRVPAAKCGQLAQFNGSIIVDRTKGELSAHCNSEEMNILLLNLAHEIVVGDKTPEECREIAAHAGWAWRKSETEPYTRELLFPSNVTAADRETSTSDPDEQVRPRY